jgi:outer membrane protein assembly factor BamD (BamD/ComL family)
VAVAPAAVPPPPPPAPAETLAPPPPAPAPTQTPPPTSAPQESSPHQAALDAGFAALESEQYNEALGKADQALAAAPHGPATAEALYLKGRALEGKNASGQLTADEIKKSLADARVAYIKALDQVPKQPLDSYIRTSLANVAYFQDDYPTAISQWSAAYEKLDRDDVKAWALYRVGVSQQRLGQFTKADQTFASVQQLHPNSVPAQRAHEHQGARAFYVQLATFASQKPAAAAANDLKRQGINTSLANDAQGHTLLRTGAIASYAQAQYFKNRLVSKYPDAVILP